MSRSASYHFLHIRRGVLLAYSILNGTEHALDFVVAHVIKQARFSHYAPQISYALHGGDVIVALSRHCLCKTAQVTAYGADGIIPYGQVIGVSPHGIRLHLGDGRLQIHSRQAEFHSIVCPKSRLSAHYRVFSFGDGALLSKILPRFVYDVSQVVV